MTDVNDLLRRVLEVADAPVRALAPRDAALTLKEAHAYLDSLEQGPFKVESPDDEMIRSVVGIHANCGSQCPHCRLDSLEARMTELAQRPITEWSAHLAVCRRLDALEPSVERIQRALREMVTLQRDFWTAIDVDFMSISAQPLPVEDTPAGGQQ